MGYSLPSDDIIYKSIIATKVKAEKTKITLVVGYDNEAKDRYYKINEAEEYWKECKKNNKEECGKQTYQVLKAIFGEILDVRFYFKGIPNIFYGDTQGEVVKRVKELFYPEDLFDKNIEERIIRFREKK